MMWKAFSQPHPQVEQVYKFAGVDWVKYDRCLICRRYLNRRKAYHQYPNVYYEGARIRKHLAIHGINP